MKTDRLHRLFASIVLMAFCMMMGVKTFHHHHCHSLHDTNRNICCVLDGELLDGHHTHHHNSYLPVIEDDEDCVICRFQVVKMPRPSLISSAAPVATACKIETLFLVSILSDYSSHSLSRAPPVG